MHVGFLLRLLFNFARRRFALSRSRSLAFLSSGMRYWRIYASLSVPCIFRFHSCNAILQSIYRDVHMTAEQNRRWNRSKIVRCNGFIVQLYRIELLKNLSNHFTFCWMQFSLVRSYFSIEIGSTMVDIAFLLLGQSHMSSTHTWNQVWPMNSIQNLLPFIHSLDDLKFFFSSMPLASR